MPSNDTDDTAAPITASMRSLSSLVGFVENTSAPPGLDEPIEPDTKKICFFAKDHFHGTRFFSEVPQTLY